MKEWRFSDFPNRSPWLRWWLCGSFVLGCGAQSDPGFDTATASPGDTATPDESPAQQRDSEPERLTTRERLSRDPSQMTLETRPDGIMKLDLKGRMQHAAIVRITADGRREHACIDTQQAFDRFLEQSEPEGTTP